MFLTAITYLFLIYYVSSESQYPILIVVSYDAFRYNYFLKNATPFMSKLKIQGTTADYLNNVFPTKTFPNHHSIATGLYPEVHGVVGNNFFDPLLGKIVTMSPEMYHYSDYITPIWTLNEKAGKGRHSGIMMWPGGVYEYQGINATYIQTWDIKYPWHQRIDTALSWVTDKTKPANLVMIYFEEPDTHGHAFGPDSQIIFNLLQQLDNVTQYLYDQIQLKGLAKKVNVVHLSDHGMSIVRPPQIINITEVLQPNTYQIADTSPCLHFIPEKGYETDVYDRLKKLSTENKHFKVYKKAQLLQRWHYKNNPRIPPILAVADAGYAFQDLAAAEKYYEKEYGIKVTDKSEFGLHGYDNENQEMHPFFITYGPGVKSSHKVPPFSTLDLYSLFASLLELKPGENNGTYANIRDILAPKKQDIPLSAAVGGFVLSLSLVGCIIAGTILYRKRKNRRDYPTTFDNILEHGNQNLIEAQHLLEPEDI